MAHDLIHGYNSGLIFLIPLLPLGCSLQTSVVPASPNSLPISHDSSISLQSHLLWCSWEGGHPLSSLLSSHSPPFLLSAAPHRHLTCMPMTLVALYLLLIPQFLTTPGLRCYPPSTPRHQCTSWAVTSRSQSYLTFAFWRAL